MTQKFAAVLEKPIGIYYEHPDWFRPLFQQLDARGVAWTRIDIRDHYYKVGAGGVHSSQLPIRWCLTA
jgi:hypothetical protein